MKNKHDVVYLDCRGIQVPIDKKIAPLLQEIWTCGARTTSSCEDVGELHADPDKKGICLIQFLDVTDAIRFLNAATVFEKGGKSLFNRMSCCGCRGVITWEYTICPYDRAYSDTRKEECYYGPADYGFLVSVYFPRSDSANIIKNLKINGSV